MTNNKQQYILCSAKSVLSSFTFNPLPLKAALLYYRAIRFCKLRFFVAIHLPFKKLSHWQHIAFSAALLERMLPNYYLFHQHTSFGDIHLLRNQLDLIWQWLDKKNRCKINYNAQITKLEEQIPSPDDFDFFGVFPAIDVTMAQLSILQGMQDPDGDHLHNIGKLSENSVSYYVQLLLIEAFEAKAIEAEISDQDIKQHPLMQWEIATQNELFDTLKNAPENKSTCIKIKALALEEGMSNLGIAL